MPLGKRLSEIEQLKIICLKDFGKNQKEIALELGRSSTLISNFLKSPETYLKKNKGGRPKLNSNRQKRSLERYAKRNKGLSSMQLGRMAGVSGCKQTICTLLNENCDRKWKKPKKVIQLNASHKLKRLEWARKYVKHDFKNGVIWSDEKRFSYSGPDGLYNSWTRSNEVNEMPRRSTNGGVHVWAGFIANKIIGPYILPNKETFNSKK